MKVSGKITRWCNDTTTKDAVNITGLSMYGSNSATNQTSKSPIIR